MAGRAGDGDACRARDALPGGSVELVVDGDRRVVAAAGDGHGDRRVAPARVIIGGQARGLGVRVRDVDPAFVDPLDVTGGVGRPIGHGVLTDARHGEAAAVGLGTAAVESVVGRDDTRTGAVVWRQAHRLAGGAPLRELVGDQAVGRGSRRRSVDPHGAAAGRARVAGVVQGLELIGMHPVVGAVCWGRHDEGAAGRREPRVRAQQAVLRAGHAASARVGGGQMDRDGAGVPGAVGVAADGRRQQIDVDVAGVVSLGVAHRVDRPVHDAGRARSRDGERDGVRLLGAAVHRVIGVSHAGQRVARRQGDLLGRVLPAGVGARLQSTGRGDRRRGVDVHIAGVGRLDVAGHVDRVVGHRVRAVPANEEGPGVELLRARIDRVIGDRDPGLSVRGSQRHALAGRQPAGMVVDRKGGRGARDGRREIDVHVAGVLRFGVAGHVDRPVLDRVRTRRRDREGRRIGLLRAAVDGVVGRLDPRLTVGRRQRDLLTGRPPSGVVGSLQTGRRGDRSRGVDQVVQHGPAGAARPQLAGCGDDAVLGLRRRRRLLGPGRPAVGGVPDGAAVTDGPAVDGVDEGRGVERHGDTRGLCGPRRAAVRGVTDDPAVAHEPARRGVGEGQGIERSGEARSLRAPGRTAVRRGTHCAPGAHDPADGGAREVDAVERPGDSRRLRGPGRAGGGAAGGRVPDHAVAADRPAVVGVGEEDGAHGRGRRRRGLGRPRRAAVQRAQDHSGAADRETFL